MPFSALSKTTESIRLRERDRGEVDWGLWGTYLPDRQWGTVREDYSSNGDAWRSFPHDHARSRAYRWGEDGLLGITDRNCLLCFAPSFWNGKDPILKERLFGLGNHEGNHGEDVKELYYHLVNTPTHSYSKALYIYPQAEFPYGDLVKSNAALNRTDDEYNIEDTGALAGGRYFKCFIEYAKDRADDILVRITIVNCGPDSAAISVVPTLWLRNTWSWGYPGISRQPIRAKDHHSLMTPALDNLSAYNFYCDQNQQWMFTENESNNKLLFNQPNRASHTKDAFHRFIVNGDFSAINPSREGTKVGMLCQRELDAGESWTIKCRLSKDNKSEPFHAEFDVVFQRRENEATSFYDSYVLNCQDNNDLSIFKASSAGLLWTRKYYAFNIYRWLRGDPGLAAPDAARWQTDYAKWKYFDAHDIFSMPDGWEYPYFCKWDLMFHAVAFADLDPAFAKNQCNILRGERFVAPNAQVPAYEWAFSDVDPPLGAWATWQTYVIDRNSTGTADHQFLLDSFSSLLIEYGWWANRNDRTGSNLFDGGFLGLDNISPFDRRFPLPDGSVIEQADGTAWMARSALYMLKIAVELSISRDDSSDLVHRFAGDFTHLVASLNSRFGKGYLNWDPDDRFYYDILRRPDGSTEHIKVRSLTGVIPILAVQSFSDEQVKIFDGLDLDKKLFDYLSLHGIDDYSISLNHLGKWPTGRHLFAVVSPFKLQKICQWLFDESEFLSEFGIRALSKYYENNPYQITVAGETYCLKYAPGESPVPMFGGNSNWRGPIWIPINYLLIVAFREYHRALGDEYLLEFPSYSGKFLNLSDIADELERRILSIFKPTIDGARPFSPPGSFLDADRSLSDVFLFHEYFHGDTGEGIGASHQTGWTAMVRRMVLNLNQNVIQPRGV
jgi:hypothetical protein